MKHLVVILASLLVFSCNKKVEETTKEPEKVKKVKKTKKVVKKQPKKLVKKVVEQKHALEGHFLLGDWEVVSYEYLECRNLRRGWCMNLLKKKSCRKAKSQGIFTFSKDPDLRNFRLRTYLWKTQHCGHGPVVESMRNFNRKFWLVNIGGKEFLRSKYNLMFQFKGDKRNIVLIYRKLDWERCDRKNQRYFRCHRGRKYDTTEILTVKLHKLN